MNAQYLRPFVFLGGLLQVVFVLVDVVQLRFVHVLVLARFFINYEPEAHPYIAQGTNGNECHLPTEVVSHDRYGYGSYQSSYGSAIVEDGGGEGTVFLGEVFRRHLDGSGEVACLTHGQDDAAEEEEPHADRGYRQTYMGCRAGIGC